MVNLCDQLEPIVKPEWGNVCFHAKFPFVWIYIEMTKKKCRTTVNVTDSCRLIDLDSK